MAPFDFSAAQATASMAEGQHASVPTQSLLMQINADAVCLVRTQFQQIIYTHKNSLLQSSYHSRFAGVYCKRPNLSSLNLGFLAGSADAPSAGRRLASFVSHRKVCFGVSYAGQNAGLRYGTKRNLR